MEAKELMQFDWVCLEDDSTPRRVDFIRTGEVGLYWNKIVTPPYIKPIPLTQEILEKNEFKKDKYDQMVLNEELGASEIHIVLQDGNDCYWWTVNGELVAKIRYVHQLQHALRLCGIKKEIEL